MDGGLSTVDYVYDGDDVIGEYDADGNLLAKYVHGPKIDEIISRTTNHQTPTTYYYHYDGLGSVRQLTDATQAVVASYDYEAFGSLRNQTGTVNNPYLFTARRLDPESGLYFYRARYYDSSVGRFISRDPILQGHMQSLSCNSYNINLVSKGIESILGLLITPQGFHPYVYVSNNPVRFIDPFGLLELCEGCSRSACLASCYAKAEAALQACLVRVEAGEPLYRAECVVGCTMLDIAAMLGGQPFDKEECIRSCVASIKATMRAGCRVGYYIDKALCWTICLPCPNP